MRKEGKLKETIKQLLFPLRCPVCDRPVPHVSTGHIAPFGLNAPLFELNALFERMGRGICPDCESGLKRIQSPFCLKCGKPLLTEEELCSDCKSLKHRFIQGRSLFAYGDMAGCIYRFKYRGRQEYAAWLGKAMAEAFADYVRWLSPDALIPVPLHEKRLAARGYNQAALLAEEIGKALHIPVYEKLVVREKNTVPQKALNRVERQNNLKKAFKIVANDVKLKTIILIDDIYTTGCTLDALAETLTEAGAEKIYFLTLSAGSPL